jgi:hypothetical protein
MNKYLRPLFVALMIASPVVATAQVQGGNEVRCSVEPNWFNKFIAGKPTPAQFSAEFSCLTLVLPGDMATSEVRTDNSRFFAELDVHGRIVDGSFR